MANSTSRDYIFYSNMHSLCLGHVLFSTTFTTAIGRRYSIWQIGHASVIVTSQATEPIMFSSNWRQYHAHKKKESVIQRLPESSCQSFELLIETMKVVKQEISITARLAHKKKMKQERLNYWIARHLEEELKQTCHSRVFKALQSKIIIHAIEVGKIQIRTTYTGPNVF